MTQIINVYCDESCHLEHDGIPVMGLGCVWCPKEASHEIAEKVREIKKRHGLSPKGEIKWGKVSPAKADFYLDLVDYFLSEPRLHFRGVIIPDKSKLDHAVFGQEHDDWYYKMYFVLLKEIIDPKQAYHIYLDYKDTRGAAKVKKLHEVLCSANYDFDRALIQKLQVIHSHESELLQLCDLLLGALTYANRKMSGNVGKERIIKKLQEGTGYQLTRTTFAREDRLNILIWTPRETQ